MSNFFEQELRKLFGSGEIMQNPKFVGRVCLGELGGDLRARAEFVTMGWADHYEALKLTVLNRTDGEVDQLTLSFRDVLGRKTVSDPSCPKGIIPGINAYGDKAWWQIYQPIAADYQCLRQVADDYLNAFREQIQERERPAPARKSPGRSASNKARRER